MSHTLQQTRRRAARWKPRLEGLETRQLLAASSATALDAPGVVTLSTLPDPQNDGLAVVQTDPAPGTVLTQSPVALTLTFNAPFDPFSLTNAGTDFELDQVAADGTTTPVDSSVLAEPDDLFDPTNTLVLSVNESLAPGEYRLTLLGTSTIAEPDFTSLANAGANLVLTDFTIQQPGVTLNDALNLGTAGPSPSVTAGALNFQANPYAVALYQVTLPAGHFWRLGAEISATRDGGTLQSDLALFDASGQVIATSDVGRSDFPQDPFLFAGLKPGTYYIGVSGMGNLPGQPGGYDPVAGTTGTIAQTQPGGAFQLHLVANPADTPTQVQGFTLNRADPLDTKPTGFTLAFSGPMNEADFKPAPDGSFGGLEVVDQSGRTWPVTPTGVQEASSRYLFVFDELLPAGTYSLQVPAVGGITDLARLTPVAPGEPSGVLATWTVSRPAPKSNPNDLGVLLPGMAPLGPVRATAVPPGAAATYRFVIACAGVYSLEELSTGGPLAIQRIGPDGVVSLTPGAPGQDTAIPMDLQPGVYALQFLAAGASPVQVHWSLVSPKTGYDSFGGGGSGPALNLTLIAPAAPAIDGGEAGTSPSAGPLAASAASSPTAITVSGPASAGATTTASPSSASPSSSPTISATSAGLALTIGGGLVGHPSAEAEHVAAVGPGTEVGTTSLALNAPGVPQGITYGLTSARQAATTPGADSGPLDESEPKAAPTDGALVVAAAPATTRADEYVLADSEWLSRLVGSMSGWFSRPVPNDPGPSTEAAPELIVLMRDDLRRDSDRVEQANMGSPLGIVLVSAVALRLQSPVKRWANRLRGKSDSKKQKHVAIRGPHTRF